MIGIPELTIIAICVGIFFFGKDKLIDWAKGVGQAKKAYRESVEAELTK